jgi:hypothetical protein
MKIGISISGAASLGMVHIGIGAARQQEEEQHDGGGGTPAKRARRSAIHVSTRPLRRPAVDVGVSASASATTCPGGDEARPRRDQPRLLGRAGDPDRVGLGADEQDRMEGDDAVLVDGEDADLAGRSFSVTIAGEIRWAATVSVGITTSALTPAGSAPIRIGSSTCTRKVRVCASATGRDEADRSRR